ncbi:MAG: ECF transporter S component [Lachnospiraceae bacterium]|nr:ECF transporter S component [Lachnospiraceae bacterium]
MQTNKPKDNSVPTATAKLTLTAMFGALAAVLMLFEFTIPFTLPFIKLDISDVPVILGAYMLGPFWGCVIAFIKIAMNFLLNGTTTVGVGELANLLFTLAYVLPAGVLYRYKRTKKMAVLSLIASTLIASVIAVILDWFVVFPFYLSVSSDLTMDVVIGMAAGVNPLVKNAVTMMWLSVFPANLLKYTCASVLTFLLYAPLRKLINSVTQK